ncbi:MAG: hypothetical protein R2856_27780 [Caldilineaceae bacterium]
MRVKRNLIQGGAGWIQGVGRRGAAIIGQIAQRRVAALAGGRAEATPIFDEVIAAINGLL